MFNNVRLITDGSRFVKLDNTETLKIAFVPIVVEDPIPQKLHLNKFGHRATDVSLYIHAKNKELARSILDSIEFRDAVNANADKTVEDLFNEYVPQTYQTPSEAIALMDELSTRYAHNEVDRLTKLADLQKLEAARKTDQQIIDEA